VIPEQGHQIRATSVFAVSNQAANTLSEAIWMHDQAFLHAHAFMISSDPSKFGQEQKTNTLDADQ